MARIAIVGTGYVGLTTGACLARLGHDVVCADVVPEKVERLQRGEIPIVEAGLDVIVREGLDSGRLTFVLGAANAAKGAEFVFLCVPTPQGHDGRADMSFIQDAAREIAPVLEPGTIVVNKSTVPVGSTRVVEQAMNREEVAVVSNPEFLREGSAVYDALHPDRIVIGSDRPDVAERVCGLFEALPGERVLTDPATAETIKYASNAFLATKISFINAMANLCEAVGADVEQVALGMGLDHRIGSAFLSPGPGWGGSCFPKDIAALIRIGELNGYDFRLLKGVVDANNEQYERVVRKVQRLVGGDVNGRTIGVWGLTFKAGTDDLRDSPSLRVIDLLRERGALVKAYDPTVQAQVGDFTACADPYEACTRADVVVLLTEWPELRDLDFDKVGELMMRKAIVDARNLLDGRALRALGFAYDSVGRP